MAMRSLFWLALLFAIAVGVAVFGHFEQGHLLLVYPPWRVDVPLTVAIVALLLAFALIYLVLRIVRGLSNLPRRVAAYRERSRDQKAHRALQEALAHLFAGRFAKAERAVRQSVELSRRPQAAALVGALAAQRSREYERRDEWLARVDDAEWAESRWLTEADLRLDADDVEGAAAALARYDGLGTNAAKRMQAQRVGWRIAQARGDWRAVLNRLKALGKRAGAEPLAVRRAREQAVEHGLRACRHDSDALLAFWHELDAQTCETPRLADMAARELIRLGAHRDARLVLEQALRSHWDPRLLRRYADCAGDDARTLIQQAEAWQTEHPADADLMYALGRLCQRQQLWGKAQSCYERGLELSQERRLRYLLHRALAEMHESLGAHEAAATHYRAGTLALEDH